MIEDFQFSQDCYGVDIILVIFLIPLGISYCFFAAKSFSIFILLVFVGIRLLNPHFKCIQNLALYCVIYWILASLIVSLAWYFDRKLHPYFSFLIFWLASLPLSLLTYIVPISPKYLKSENNTNSNSNMIEDLVRLLTSSSVVFAQVLRPNLEKKLF